MPPEVTILYMNHLGSSEKNFMRLSRYLGVEYRIVRYENSAANLYGMGEVLGSNEPCTVMSCKTLASICQNDNNSHEFIDLVCTKIGHLFVYGFQPGNESDIVVRYLTGDNDCHLSFFNNCYYKYEVSSDFKKITRQFSGISFGPINNSTDFNFSTTDHSKNVSTLISINNRPFFIATRRMKCNLFLIACKGIKDIDEEVPEDYNIINDFSQTVPAIMFLKYVFKDECWDNKKTLANFIIDDPLLQKRYGFLSYRELPNIMDNNEFTSTIAFIPWNYKRTSRDIARLFQQRADRFTICIHGCDHTKYEFGSTDCKYLDYKARLSTWRMHRHQERTGVPFDNVMIFPQGEFSLEAMKVLKQNNFLAAVNSSAIPHGHYENRLKVSDYMDVAIMNYEKFPLFLRRYPTDIAKLAFDAFLGKPLLIVEHHGYFRNGYKKLTDFLGKVNALAEGVHWRGLGDVLKNSYLVKKGAEGYIYCRIYTNEVLVENESEDISRYIIIKDVPDFPPLGEVLINGTSVPYHITDNRLNIMVEIGAKEIADIVIKYKDTGSLAKSSEGLAKEVKVYLRRHLGEFKDNYISKSNTLLKIADRVAKGV